jgi:hypothetical protein
LLHTVLICLCAGGLSSRPAAQAPETPSIKLGTTIFADYTVQQAPKVIDADGTAVTLSSFNITRTYLNVTGRVSPRVSFRLTPDIAREVAAGNSLNGSYVFRLKFAYGQLALDSWLPKGSWTRLGLQPTPWMEFLNDVYRYRFQGQVFAEREGYQSFSDTGVTARVVLPRDYGEVHGGVYNGEGSYLPETNNRKGWMVRATARPLPGRAVVHGLRVSAFLDRDGYTAARERDRGIFSATFEHPRLNAGYEFLTTADRPPPQVSTVHGHGWSLFLTPRTKWGWEGLVRLDHLEPDRDRPSQVRNRAIGGVAYWLKPVNGVTSALLLDVETTRATNFTPAQALQRRIALHMLINY